jgi:hypothetical protein
MKVDLSGSGVLALAGVVIVVGGLGYLLFKLVPKLKTLATTTLNPASSDNIVNQGVTTAVSSTVGYPETLGGAIADKVFQWRHPDFQMSGATASKVNPTVKPDLSKISNSGPAPYDTQYTPTTTTTDGDITANPAGPVYF